MTAKAAKPVATHAITLPPLWVRAGNTDNTITLRTGGNEGLSLQSAAHGVQQIANFNPAIGDFLSLDSILNQTMAHASLADLTKYISSQVVNGGTMLYLDPTGHGAQTTPFAFLQGTTTSVSQLLAAGAFKYVPQAMTVTPTFNTPTDLRPDGLATVLLNRIVSGIGPQQINGFNPMTDKLELANILNRTLARPDLSDVSAYIKVTALNGSTILSVDPSGQGGTGTAFAVLNNTTVTLNQLLGDGALMFDPTRTLVTPLANVPFTFRAEGTEMAMVRNVAPKVQPTQFLNFSLASGDALNVGGIVLSNHLNVSPDTVQNFFMTVQSGADTQLWLDPTGSGVPTTLEAVFKNASFTMNDLVEHSAFSLSHGTPTTQGPGFIMHMGCTNTTITYQNAGNEGVCVQSVDHGVQQLAGFDPSNGDFISVDDVLEQTQAHDDMSDVAQYVTSQVMNGGTMLYADLTGQGLRGTPFAFLQGVQTTVADMVADGGLRYLPDDITLTPAAAATVDLRPDGLETVMLSTAPGLGPTQINDFNPTMNENIELSNILGKTLAAPDLSDIAKYITVTHQGNNTVMSLDSTGHGLAGTAFAVLTNVNLTLPQMLADHALMYDPAGVTVMATANTPFTYRSAGAEIANLQSVNKNTATQALNGFALNAGDGINVMHILGNADIQTDLSNIQNYFSTVQSGDSTQLWFDPSGSGQGGTLEAVFQHTSVTLNDLLAHGAIHIAGQ